MGALRPALILYLAVAAGACAGGSGRPRARLDRHPAEVYAIEVGGRQRSFILAPGTRTGGPKPLMLIYHGSEGTAQAVLDQTALGLAAIEAGMAVASLDAAPGTNGRWSTSPTDTAFIDDVAFTRAVIAAIAADVRIDSARILAVGYSRGAQFTYQLACRAPGLVRAIVPVAGAMPASYRRWCDAPAAPPRPAVMAVYGTNDPVAAEARRSAAEWAERHRCTGVAAPAPVPARRPYWKVSRREYAPCATGDLVVYEIEPLEHLWPGTAFDVERAITAWFLALPKR